MYIRGRQLVTALSKIAKATSAPSLVEVVKKHFEEMKVHVVGLEQVAELLGITTRALRCNLPHARRRGPSYSGTSPA